MNFKLKKEKNNENEEHAQVLFLFIFLPTELDGIDSNNSILIRCLIYIRILIIGYIIFHAKIREYQYHSLIDSEKTLHYKRQIVRFCGTVGSSVSGIGISNNEYNFCFNFFFPFRFVRGSGSFLLISQQKRSR